MKINYVDKDKLEKFSDKDEISFFLVQASNKEMTVKIDRQLDNEDTKIFKIFNDSLGLLHQLVQSFYICKSSYDYLNYVVNQIKNTLSSNAKCARGIIDFLSDTRLIINFLESWTKNNLNSRNYKEWKKFESGFYDKFLSYRISYHLRNIAQHKLFIIGGINVQMTDNHNTKKDIYLNKDVLDNNFFKKTKTSAEFFENSKHSSLMPYLESYYIATQSFYLQAGRMFFNEHIDDIKTIIKLCKNKGYNSRILYGTTNKEKILNNDWNINTSEIITTSRITDVLDELNNEKIANVNFISSDDNK